MIWATGRHSRHQGVVFHPFLPPPLTKLQVQSFNLLLRLRLHDPIPRGPEIGHLHPHSPLAERHQACFGAYCLDVRAGELVFLTDELFELDVFAEGHFGGVEVEDLAFGILCSYLLVASSARSGYGRGMRGN